MRCYLVLIPLLLFVSRQVTAQKYGYTIKGGAGIASQRWQGGSGGRTPLRAYHADLGVDWESEGGNVIYGQLGYHQRGSGLRVLQFVDVNGNILPGGTFGMRFHNLALEAGMKKFFLKGQTKAYYGLGVRVEYTMDSEFEFLFLQYKDFVQKFNYGFSVRVGTEFKLGKLVMGGVEAQVAPDISRQIWVPSGIRVIDPRTNMVSNGTEQNVRNLCLELSVYLRFLQIIEYID